jgi:hypothetical protein
MSELNKYKLEKRRIEQLERNMLWQPKSGKEPRVRSSNTYESGIPVNPISQQVKQSEDGNMFK